MNPTTTLMSFTGVFNAPRCDQIVRLLRVLANKFSCIYLWWFFGLFKRRYSLSQTGCPISGHTDAHGPWPLKSALKAHFELLGVTLGSMPIHLLRGRKDFWKNISLESANNKERKRPKIRKRKDDKPQKVFTFVIGAQTFAGPYGYTFELQLKWITIKYSCRI